MENFVVIIKKEDSLYFVDGIYCEKEGLGMVYDSNFYQNPVKIKKFESYEDFNICDFFEEHSAGKINWEECKSLKEVFDLAFDFLNLKQGKMLESSNVSNSNVFEEFLSEYEDFYIIEGK